MGRALFLILGLLMCVGCAVVDNGTAGKTYPILSEWKVGADELLASNDYDKIKYREARLAVNGWIETKKTEITIAGGKWFTKVYLTKPEGEVDHDFNKVKEKVDLVIIKKESLLGPEDIVDTVKIIIEFICGMYKDARLDEAKKACALLDGYKWSAQPIKK